MLFLNPLPLEKLADFKPALDLKTPLLTILVVLADVSGNTTMSWGLKHQNPLVGVSPLAYLALIFDPWLVLGTALLLVWFLSRVILFSWADLSYVLPVTSFSYVLNALTGHFLLNEHIAWPRWIGTLIITAGAVLVGLTPANSTDAPGEPV